MIEGGDGRLGERELAHMKAVRRILRFLATDERIAHMQERLRVFGSAAAGKPVPGDVDVLVDFSDHPGSYLHPSAIPQADLLLAVGRQFYGQFDPFVLVGSLLWVRDDASAGWIEARRKRDILRAAREDGRLADDVYAEIRARPPERGGAPRSGAAEEAPAL